MDFSSWFRKALLKKSEPIITNTSTSSDSIKVTHHKEEEEEEEELGVTDQLRDFVKSFTIETFKNFPLQDDQGTTTTTLKINDGSSTNSEIVQKDLSDWQERHAMLVLTKVKEISQLRYTLCPRHLKERQFWKIYFMLVKIYVAPYELQAIRQAKLRRMAKKDEKSLDSGFEVEMAEAKRPTSMSSPSLERKSGSQLDDDGSREVQEDNL